MLVTFSHSEDVAQGIRTFWFKPMEPMDYLAGQFTQLHLPCENSDNLGDKRWFTLSSSPSDEMVSITTKLSDETSSFKKALSELKRGTGIALADPMGDFVLPKDETLPLVFVAAGIGITPFHSIVKYLLDSGENRRIQLIYAVSEVNQLAWSKLFEQYPLDFIPLVKNPPKDWRGESGKFDAARILGLAEISADSRIYISGPEKLVEKIQADLILLGIAEQQLIVDYFHGYSV